MISSKDLKVYFEIAGVPVIIVFGYLLGKSSF